MSDFDFKKHSLQRLEEWLCDAMDQPDTSSQDIYNTIINVIEEHVNYYQKGFLKTNHLLSLLQGKLNNDVFNAAKKEYEYYEGEPFSYKEAIEKGWTMTDDGFWIPPSKKND